MNTKAIITAAIMLIGGIFIGKYFFSESVINDHHQGAAQSTPKVEEHWTCSMHPQIDMPEFGACPICGMDLIPLEESSGGDLDPNQFKMNAYAMSLANIQTTTVGEEIEVGGISNQEVPKLNLSGRIIQNEKNKQMQTAHVGGRIEKLYFKSLGEYIKEGSIIALIYSADMVTAQNELIQALEIKESQPELYKAIRKKLSHWKISERAISQLEQTKKVVTNYPLIANVSGTIVYKFVNEGDHVMEGSKMFEVSKLSSLWAEFDVFERDLTSVRNGSHLLISPNAYPDKKIKATINFINPLLDPNTRTIKVRATISNDRNLLKPGMILTAEMKRRQKNDSKSVISIPKSAVLWTGKRSIVYIKSSKELPIFELREVELGRAIGSKYELLSGLENGEELVTNGTFTLDATAQLNNKASMMNTLIQGEKKEVKEEIPNYMKTSSKEFKIQLTLLTKSYFDLKNAFVNTDSHAGNNAAEKLLRTMKKVDMSLLKGDAHNYWMKQLKALKVHSMNIQKSKKVEEQRKQFEFVTKALLNAIKSFGIVGEPIYIQHCPMAFDNKGADWISEETGIRNPYFGDKMMKCGTVLDTIL